MSKVKELEAQLVAAVNALAKLRTQVKKLRDGAPRRLLQERKLVEVFEQDDVKELFKWRTEHRRALRDIDTVSAKVVSATMPKRKLPQVSDESEYVGKTLKIGLAKFKIVSAKGRLVKTKEGNSYPKASLVKMRGGWKVDAKVSDWSLRKPTKAERTAEHERTHETIAQVARQGAEKELKRTKEKFSF